MYNNYVDSGIIEPEALKALLNKDNPVKLIDATYAPSAAQQFEQTHISGAVYFDIDDVADLNAPLPHTVPSEGIFEAKVSEMGINNDDFIVVYDQFGVAMAASRVWWMFRLFGHGNVCVLNGGLAHWRSKGFETETGASKAANKGVFKAKYRPELLKNLDLMKQAYKEQDISILDARAAERFYGQIPEGGQNLRSGHIPHSENLPFMDLINEHDYRLKDADFIKETVSKLSLKENIITTCGSGVTACVISLALHHIGIKDVPVYDGSWTEWGNEKAGTEVAA